jgi:hypothetical protein
MSRVVLTSSRQLSLGGAAATVQVQVIRPVSGYNVSQVFDVQIVVHSITVVEQVREGVYVHRYFYPTRVLCGG